MTIDTALDPNDARIASTATGLLREFNAAGVIDSADVHVATMLGRVTGETGEAVLLAAACIVAATRGGSVCVDLESASDYFSVEADAGAAALPWPEPERWLSEVAASPLLNAPNSALRLEVSRLYLDRYHRYEQDLAQQLIDRRRAGVPLDEELLSDGLDRLFPAGEQGGDAQQRLGAETAVRRQLAVLAGGPGTGKTTTIARIIALMHEQLLVNGRPPLIGLAAPTGRAAARLKEAVGEQGAEMNVAEDVRGALVGAEARTLHSLLGWQPFNQSRFKHNAKNPLPHDVIIVDESSMISLALMSQLFDAVAPNARVVLVGDPRQLASIDAGTAFGDIVGPVTDHDADAGIVVLQKVHRFGGEISELAQAVLAGDSDAAIAVLGRGDARVRWLETEPGEDPRNRGTEAIAGLRPYWESVMDAAQSGDYQAAFAELAHGRILCAHRNGSHGAAGWNELAFKSIAADREFAVRRHDSWFVGRPLLAIQNDYQLGMFNGDTGVVVAGPNGEPLAAFDRIGDPLRVSPERLKPVQTAYAATVHRSQGSQFGSVLVVLPPEQSQVLTRELLYTAITRAQKQVIILGSRESLVAAINRESRRASGLRERLWPNAD